MRPSHPILRWQREFLTWKSRNIDSFKLRPCILARTEKRIILSWEGLSAQACDALHCEVRSNNISVEVISDGVSYGCLADFDVSPQFVRKGVYRDRLLRPECRRNYASCLEMKTENLYSDFMAWVNESLSAAR